MRRGSLALTLSLSLMLLGGCAGPAERFDERASALGFSTSRVEGEGFTHVVYRPARLRPDGGRVLHVYLDGDGTPWARGRPAAEPPPPPPPPVHPTRAPPDGPRSRAERVSRPAVLPRPRGGATLRARSLDGRTLLRGCRGEHGGGRTAACTGDRPCG